MDEEYEKRGHAEAKLLTQSPTEIVHSHAINFSCEADEPLLPQALAYVGNDRIMYASDFPHWDHSYPKSVKELADRADLSDEAKRQVLAGNAKRFYHL
jgi:predicted TIM-barrel fold metal-dependent hydrolase